MWKEITKKDEKSNVFLNLLCCFALRATSSADRSRCVVSCYSGCVRYLICRNSELLSASLISPFVWPFPGLSNRIGKSYHIIRFGRGIQYGVENSSWLTIIARLSFVTKLSKMLLPETADCLRSLRGPRYTTEKNLVFIFCGGFDMVTILLHLLLFHKCSFMCAKLFSRSFGNLVTQAHEISTTRESSRLSYDFFEFSGLSCLKCWVDKSTRLSDVGTFNRRHNQHFLRFD